MIKIPARLSAILHRDPSLAGSVESTLATFEPWISDNKLPFFPEFTDHGPTHINSVLQSAEALIADTAFSILSPADIAVLTFSIVLHDSAMHLSEDGFSTLLNEATPVLRRDAVPWKKLWTDFISEAHRFDASTLRGIFGDTEPIRTPPNDPTQYTVRDRLLIGDFVRRHHPRIAHEIALDGIPGVAGRAATKTAFPRNMADIAGFVARSHGHSIRQMVDELPAENRRVSEGAHVTFLMAILRIADYIQIEAPRAPEALLAVKQLRSPISQREWRIHSAIREIHLYHEDPEALFVRVDPPTAQTYFSVRRLLNSIQNELDESWGTLGEVYGRYGSLTRLQLTIRRLRSNIDFPERFEITTPFFLRHARFRSNESVVPLLVRPLYGDSPGVAVRELMQNAVDAVRERADIEHQRDPVTRVNARSVVIELEVGDEKSDAYLTVTDEGIGMSPATIVDYFLTAGASFRWSKWWLEHHTDSKGESRVLRSGRFGIGVLAAFLVGDEIEVSTRHADEEVGVEFRAQVDSEFIELKKCVCPVGTRVRIKLRSRKLIESLRRKNEPHDLAWDWYVLDEPRVIRKVDGQVATQAVSWPAASSQLPEGWNRLLWPGYEDIHWRFHEAENSAYSSRLVACNGIKMHLEYSSPLGHVLVQTDFYDIHAPALSIFDRAGRLPINLARDRFVEAPEFTNRLIEQVCEEVLAALVARAPVVKSFTDSKRLHSAFNQKYSYPLRHLWMRQDGWALAEPAFFKELEPGVLVTILTEADQEQVVDGPALIWAESLNAIGECVWFCRWVIEKGAGTSNANDPRLRGVGVSGAALRVTPEWWRDIKNKKRIPAYVLDEVRVEAESDDWIVLATADWNADVAPWVNEEPSGRRVGGAKLCFRDVKDAPPTPLADIWLSRLKQTVIPFGLQDRATMIQQLPEHMRRWVAMYQAASKDHPKPAEE